MSCFNQYQESVIVSWIGRESDVELPCECRYLHPEPVRISGLGDLADCFIDYLEENDFGTALDEDPSAITRLDAPFDLLVEDHLFECGD